MAINPETQYPGKIAPSTPEYPYGAARNISVPGDGTGTPWESALVNDIFGFQQALLSDAAIVPSGTPEKATESQYLTSLNLLRSRRAVTPFASVQDMLDGVPRLGAPGAKVTPELGALYSTGGTLWEVKTSAGLDMGGGFFASPASEIYISDFDSVNDFADRTSVLPFVNAVMSDGDVITGPLTVQTDTAITSGGPVTVNAPGLDVGVLIDFADGVNAYFKNFVIDFQKGKVIQPFNLYNPLSGNIRIEKCGAKNVGDTSNDAASPDWFAAFFVIGDGAGTLDIIEPIVEDIHVKPNAIIGDTNGSNRAVHIQGDVNTQRKILVKDPRVTNLSPFEDADAVVVQIGSGGSKQEVDVTLDGGRIKDAYKRGFKIQAGGVRMIGFPVVEFTGVSSKPVSGVSAYEGPFGRYTLIMDANVRTIGEVTYGYDFDGVDVVGSGSLVTEDGTQNTLIDGNTTRGIWSRGAGGVKLPLVDINGYFNNYSFEADYAEIVTLRSDGSPKFAGRISALVDIGLLSFKCASTEDYLRTEFPLRSDTLKGSRIGNIQIDFTTTGVDPDRTVRVQGSGTLFEGGRISSPGSQFAIENRSNDNFFRSIRGDQSIALVRTESSVVDRVYVNGCQHPLADHSTSTGKPDYVVTDSLIWP